MIGRFFFSGNNYSRINTDTHSRYIPEKQVQIRDERGKTDNFESDLWKYQTYQAQIIMPYNSIEKTQNSYIARKILDNFNNKYPNLSSYTLAEAKLKEAQRKNYPQQTISELQKNTDILFNKMIQIYENRNITDLKDITFSEYLNMIKQELTNEKFANCGERAYVVYDELKKLGIDNHAIVEIEGDENYNSHVFNVIGLDKNANISDPSTWGNNAIIIDSWLGKTYTIEEGLEYYKDFLGYDEQNKMRIFEDCPDKIFKKT